MSDTPVPIPVHPWPISEERLSLIREAKARIRTDVKIIPVPAEWGSPGRVLAFGSLPPFMCKTIPIRPENVDNVDSIEAALRACLDPWFPESQFDEAWQLSSWMGADVRLSHEEDELGGVVFK